MPKPTSKSSVLSKLAWPISIVALPTIILISIGLSLQTQKQLEKQAVVTCELTNNGCVIECPFTISGSYLVFHCPNLSND